MVAMFSSVNFLGEQKLFSSRQSEINLCFIPDPSGLLRTNQGTKWHVLLQFFTT